MFAGCPEPCSQTAWSLSASFCKREENFPSRWAARSPGTCSRFRAGPPSAPGPFSSVPPLLLRGEFGQGDNDKRRTSFLSTHVPQKSPGESRHVSMAVTGSVIGPGVTAQRSAAAGAATRLMCRREAGSSAVCSVTSQHGKRLLCARRRVRNLAFLLLGRCWCKVTRGFSGVLCRGGLKVPSRIPPRCTSRINVITSPWSHGGPVMTHFIWEDGHPNVTRIRTEPGVAGGISIARRPWWLVPWGRVPHWTAFSRQDPNAGVLGAYL